MAVNVEAFFFFIQALESMVWPTPDSQPWRVWAIKQLWLDQPDLDFCEAIRHPAFAPYAAELAAWHRLFQRYLADYQRRDAREIPRLMKVAPPGNIKLPRDPWLNARTSAWYADSVRELRREVIDGGYYFRMERSPLDED